MIGRLRDELEDSQQDFRRNVEYWPIFLHFAFVFAFLDARFRRSFTLRGISVFYSFDLKKKHTMAAAPGSIPWILGDLGQEMDIAWGTWRTTTACLYL